MRSESDGHCAADVVPRPRRARARAQRSLAPLVASRRRTATTRPSRLPRARRRACASASGWDASFVAAAHRARSARSTAASSSTATGRSRTCCVATGHPGLAVPDELATTARVHAYEPHEYAAKVASRRRRHGGGDRVAERARRRCRGGLGAAARAAAPPAERAARRSSRSGASRASTASPPSERARRCATLLAPSYPPGRDWDAPLVRPSASDVPRRAATSTAPTQVICATGFRTAAGTIRCLRDSSTTHELETHDRLDRARTRLDRSGAHRRRAHAVARRRRRPVGVPAADTIAGAKYAARALPTPRMSYTLRGRIESRLVATLPPLLVALAIHRWWAIELVALMLAVGLALDVCVYDRLLAYQPGWLALPLGALELGAARARDAHAGDLAPRSASSRSAGRRPAVRPRGLPARAARVRAGGRRARPHRRAHRSVRRRRRALGRRRRCRGDPADGAPPRRRPGTARDPHAQTLVGGVVRGGIVIRADHVSSGT